ncbi:CNNM domain-containing protein, partial [Staphylococcus aureus]
MIFAIIILIFISFFFSGSETALTAANNTKFKTEADKGDYKSKDIVKLLEKPSEIITTILIGNNVANIILTTLVTI